MKPLPRKLKGFTLLEVITALGLFTIIMMAIMQIFGTSFKAYRDARILQHDLENAQYAINAMAKELRTSSITAYTTGGGDFGIRFFDYSQNQCIRYFATAASGTLIKDKFGFSAANPNANRISCIVYTFQPADRVGNVASGITAGSLSVTRSTPITPGPGVVGKATISLTFGNSTKPVTMQTTVSLRDFNYVGI